MDFKIGDTIWVDPRDYRIPGAQECRIEDVGELVMGGQVVAVDHGRMLRVSDLGNEWWLDAESAHNGMDRKRGRYLRYLLGLPPL